MMLALALLLAQDPEPLKVDEKAGRVSFGARVAKQDVYEQLKGFLEYLIVMPGGKEYESVFIAPVDPVKLHEGMQKIGLKPGKPGYPDEKKPPEGAKMQIWVEWGEGDQKKKEPVEAFVLDVLAKKPMDPGGWVYAGSKEAYNPAQDKMTLMAAATKNVISLYHSDQSVLVQPGALPKDPHQFKANKDLLPKAGTLVRIVMGPVK